VKNYSTSLPPVLSSILQVLFHGAPKHFINTSTLHTQELTHICTFLFGSVLYARQYLAFLIYRIAECPPLSTGNVVQGLKYRTLGFEQTTCDTTCDTTCVILDTFLNFSGP
jgi:hypothetical protein